MPTLFLLPGLDGTGLLFADFIAALRAQSPSIKVVPLAYPADTPLTYSELTVLVGRRLSTDPAFFLLAESFSGPIALAIAATPPEGLRGIILCCSFARTPRPTLSGLARILPRLPPVRLPMAAISPWVLGRFSTAPRCEALRCSLARVAPRVLQHRASTALVVNMSDLLDRIDIPLLYLRASEDRIIPRSSSALLASRVRNFRCIDFTAPHFLLQTVPTAAATAVLSFMESPSGSTTP